MNGLPNASAVVMVVATVMLSFLSPPLTTILVTEEAVKS